MFEVSVSTFVSRHPSLWTFLFVLTALLVLRVLCLTLTYPEHIFAEWIRTELYIFLLWFLFEYSPERHDSKACRQNQLLWRLCLLPSEVPFVLGWAIAVAATVLAGLLHHYVVPAFIYRLCWRRSLRSWFCVQQVQATADLRFSYRPWGWFSWQTCEFHYEGEKDEEGKPHGTGMWQDSSFHGECLSGHWVHGEPRGSWRSREYGTGAQFAQIPIAYVTSRADCPPFDLEKTFLLPSRGDSLRYGVGQVEVSLAGGFYPFLPSVEHHTPYESMDATLEELAERQITHSFLNDLNRDANRCELRLLVMSDQVSRDDEIRRASIESDEESMQEADVHIQFRTSGSLGFTTAAGLGRARSLLEKKQEALVFIHGYTSSIARSLTRMAQMFASGAMSPHIFPFVFSYSGGSHLTYQQVKWQMKDYALDLRSFLLELSLHFRTVHILCHSCGAEFFFVNFEEISECFEKAPGYEHEQEEVSPHRTEQRGSLRLATLTMLNPDVPADLVCSTLPRVMSVAQHFTSYNDSNDGALFYSGWITYFLPQAWQSSAVQPGDAHPGVMFGRLVQPMWLESSETGNVLVCPGLDRDNVQIRSWRAGDAGDMQEPKESKIDIIDCSGLETNIHSLRHNYYMLNTQMVEDICELISERLPAKRRSRLIRRQGNVYNFLCPPKHVKSF
eukprot:TRINITY_DN28988_c0_g1_i1.p1 TRINITY_DN28988_c0_g1~~TRINITY_DN28988_c0_g1_i1.p1  ORF type:complete len:715 (+),score=98.84 TRINITY_DN28988_c0_g1_i1:128-2146(+)